MEIHDLREAYRKLNESFKKKKLVYHAGKDAGFFCEYDGMLRAMLYCLRHGIQFTLYSEDASYRYEKGWSDYFESFCREEHSFWHHYINSRYFSFTFKKGQIRWALKSMLYVFIAKIWKLFHPNVLLTQDVRKNIFSKSQDRQYNIPELGINGDIFHAFEVLANMTLQYREDIKRMIHDYTRSVCPGDKFISCQVRAGDKITECDLLPVEIYIDKIEEYQKKGKDMKNVFVLTDDYLVMRKAKALRPAWNWHSFCREDEKGYVNSAFKRLPKAEKKRKIVRLLASMEMIHSSEIFIGTITSSPSTFSSLRDPGKTVFIDYDKDVFSHILK